jgi:hypothetical protein
MGAVASTALTVGILVAAPVVIALIGDRIASLKGFGLEVSLIKEATMPIAGDGSRVAGDLSKVGMKEDLAASAPAFGEALGSSVDTDPGSLSEVFDRLIDEGSHLLRINLRDGNYWWSTRVFLVAALAQDYTEVRALVFVKGDESFIGIGAPGAVRRELGAYFARDQYEATYTKARATALTEMGDLDNLRPSESAVHEVNALLKGWPNAWPPPMREQHLMQKVSGKALREWLPASLDTRSVRDEPLNERLLYRILSHDRRYVALTDDSRLMRVIDRDELALQMATDVLEKTMAAARPT